MSVPRGRTKIKIYCKILLQNLKGYCEYTPLLTCLQFTSAHAPPTVPLLSTAWRRSPGAAVPSRPSLARSTAPPERWLAPLTRNIARRALRRRRRRTARRTPLEAAPRSLRRLNNWARASGRRRRRQKRSAASKGGGAQARRRPPWRTRRAEALEVVDVKVAVDAVNVEAVGVGVGVEVARKWRPWSLSTTSKRTTRV